MADEIKRLFEKNRVELAEYINLDEAMWNQLRIDSVLSAAERDKIKLNKTSFEQIMALLDFLEKRSDEAVIKFCMSLRATNQGHIADRLLTPSGPTKTFPTSNLPGDMAKAEYGIQRRSMRTIFEDNSSPADDIFDDLPPEYAAVFDDHEKRAVMDLWLSVISEKQKAPDIPTNLENTQCGSSDEAVCSFPFHVTPQESSLTSKQNLPMAIGVYVPDRAASADIQGCITQKHYIEQFPLKECRVGPLMFAPHGEQFNRPLAVLVALPDEIFCDDQQYDYIVQYSNDLTEKTGDLNWEDVTSFREQHVSGVVLPQHRMAFLLMSHFCKICISTSMITACTEVFAHWDDTGPTVRITCLMYLNTSYHNHSGDYHKTKECIKMQKRWEHKMSVPRKKKKNIEVSVNHEANTGWNLMTPEKQEIEHAILWDHSFPVREFVFISENAKTPFGCNFHAQNDSSVVDIYVNSFLPSGGQEVNSQDNAIADNELNLITISDMAMDRLIRNRSNLAETIIPYLLWDHLESNLVINKAVKDHIRLNRTEQEQVGELLDYIGKRPFTDYVYFCIAIIKTNQAHVVRRWLWDKEWTTSIAQEHRAMFQQIFP